MIRPFGGSPRPRKMILMAGFRRCCRPSCFATTRSWMPSRSTPIRPKRLRDAAAAVELAREGGLPVSEAEQAGLPAGERRLAIDAPTVTQIPSLEAADDSDIVDAELIEQPREELR